MLINIRQRLDNLKAISSLVIFIAAPTKLDSVFKVALALKNSDLSNRMKEILLSDPQMQEMVEKRWQPQHKTLEELKALPQGTLGYLYANQLLSLGLSPDDLLPKEPVVTDDDYIELRLRQTHDIVHVLTGFGTNPEGEIGLQAFNLASYKTPLAALLIFGSIIRGLKGTESFDIDALLVAISKGFIIGKKSKLLVSQKLEEQWERNIEDLRREYNIEIKGE
jgi:ubiquinone biosynthesis protein COQ4